MNRETRVCRKLGILPNSAAGLQAWWTPTRPQDACRPRQPGRLSSASNLL